MENVGRGGRWKNLKQRLGLKGMGCCGSSWVGLTPSALSVRDDDEEIENRHEGSNPTNMGQNPDPVCEGQIPVVSGMNLATALAEERQFRAAQDSAPGTPSRVSLMRLLEETNGGDGDAEERGVGGGGGSDLVCCVCMGRRKGAAFIPCGHTYCRVCSRELWLNRGSCPLCNRSILEILDIF